MATSIELWGVNDPNISAQLALAYVLNLFKREAGLDVVCHFIESGTTMADDILTSSHRPFAFTQTPATVLRLHEHGVRAKIVAPLADIAGTQQVIVRKASGIHAPEDLHGKEIGIANGAAMFLAFKNMAKDYNVDLNTVRFVDLLPQDQLDAFQEGKIDVFASWEPWTSRAKMMGGQVFFSGNHSAIPGNEGERGWLINQSCLIAPDEHLAAEPEIVVAILNVLRKTTDLLNHHRQTILDPLADFFNMTRVELLMAMQRNHYSMSVTNLFRLGVLSFRDFLYDIGEISLRLPENLLYDLRYLREVDSSLVFLEETVDNHIKIFQQDGVYYREDFSIPPETRAVKVMLADDSRYVRASLAKAIKQIGGEVIAEATTGSEAIEKFAFLRPDIVTMDLSMPGVSGLEAIKILLQIDPNLTIIVVSGTDLQEVREEVFNLGVKMFITKPFDPAHVAEIFQQNLAAAK